MNSAGKVIVSGLAGLVLLQVLHPSIPQQKSIAEVDVPAPVREVLRRDCYACHSTENRLAWFDQIAPAYWLVRHDVLTARRHVNFSTLGAKPVAAQKAALYEGVNMVQLGAMPLASFKQLHPEARVTAQDLDTLKQYLAPWSAQIKEGIPDEPAVPVPAATVHAEFNGLPFDAGFEGWRALSFTDRGDNNTLRFILGNEAAVAAARTGNVSPWPDGARFAKIAWQKRRGQDGLIFPGAFLQVEFMDKNAVQYRKTDGWGWGRWRGLELRPYGKDGEFVQECTGCHMPVRGNDSVYTLPISAAPAKGTEVLNQPAVLPAKLPFSPLDWRAITMYLDPKNQTMAVLFGNDEAAKSVVGHSAGVSYGAGAVLSLVTWSQREDPHWFGARIPGRPVRVEFVEILVNGTRAYSCFAGNDLQPVGKDELEAKARVAVLTGLEPVSLPQIH